MEIKAGKIYQGLVTSIAVGGDGIVKLDDLVIFVPFVIPEEEIAFKITELKKNYGRGQLERIIQPSPARTTPLCQIQQSCGGCQWQHINYLTQLKLKKQIVEDQLKQEKIIAPVKDLAVTSQPFYYRNKAQTAVGYDQDNNPTLGLYTKGSHHLVDIPYCVIQRPLNNQILQFMKGILTHLKWKPYQEKNDSGLIKHIIVRAAVNTEEFMLVVVAKKNKLPSKDEFIKEITKKFPQIKSIYLNVNPLKGNVVLGETSVKLWGKDVITEKVENLSFNLSPTSFFQTNPYQFTPLVESLNNYIAGQEYHSVVDAYCGVGFFSLFLASHCQKLIGLEEVGDSVKSARENASLNKITNCIFQEGKVEDLLPKLIREGLKPDLVVIDPPRKGCEPLVLDIIEKAGVTKIIYLSCHPATLARDLKFLTGFGFQVKEVTLFDMFPQTWHVEIMACLEK